MLSKTYTPTVENSPSSRRLDNKLRDCNPIGSLSERPQMICLILCAVTFLGCNYTHIVTEQVTTFYISAICILIKAINNPICVEKKYEKKDNHMQSQATVSLSGLYKLVDTDNYVDYLTSLEVPAIAASHIDRVKSENISVEEDGHRATITTSTPWISKTITFKFDEPFSVNYGDSRSNSNKTGVLNYFCYKPKENIINCNSKEEKKGWKIVFDLIFTDEFLVNKSFFITKDVGMTKKYRRVIS